MSAIKFKLVRVADGAEYPVTGDLLVGRLDECDVRVTQGLPSRRHAQLSMVGQSVWVEDLGSVNGTYINGVRIAAKSSLKSGDRVRFDLEEFQFHAVPEVAPQAVSAPTMYRPLAQELAERPPDKPQAALPADKPAPSNSEPSAPSSPATRPLAPAAPEPPVAEGSGLFKRPGAWADPDFDDGANKTKFMDPVALKSMLDAPKVVSAPSAASVDAPCLVMMSGASLGARINLGSERGSAEWTIGSGVDCQIVIADNGVSALHAKLINDGKRWKLVDQMSANGTYVNGKRSTVSYLSGGDRIVLGPVECEIRLPASAHVEPAPASSEMDTKKPMLIAIAVGGAIALLALIWALWLR